MNADKKSMHPTLSSAGELQSRVLEENFATEITEGTENPSFSALGVLCG